MIDKEKVITLIENTNDVNELKSILSNYHNFDIAEIIKNVDSDKQALIMSLFTDEELADILAYMDADDTSDILSDVDNKKAASIINEMEPDDAADVLDELETEQASEIINLLDADVKEDINNLSKYADGTAGSIMNSNFLMAYEYWDVKDAMRLVVKEAPDVENINTIMIVDKNDVLVGTLDLKKLIISKSPCQLNEIMVSHFQAVKVEQKIEEVVKMISDYDTYLMPVIDDNGIIKGIITMDDAFDEAVDAVEDDYAKLAGLTEGEESDESVGLSIKKRIPWLIILLFLDLGVSLVISMFSKVIVAVPLLAFFQAAVLGLAGNCGTQSLAVAVRRISENKLNKTKLILKHLTKETLLGICTGLVLGIVSFGLVVGMLYLKKEVEIPPVKIALVLSVSITCAVATSNLFGALVPVIFYKCKVDPAVASGPFITTINDVIVVILYFGIAMIMLGNYL